VSKWNPEAETATYSNNVRNAALEDPKNPDKYCYVTGTGVDDGLVWGIGCHLFKESHFENHGRTESGRLLHVDPDFGLFEAEEE